MAGEQTLYERLTLFFANQSKADLPFVRARFILLAQIEIEDVLPSTNDPELIARVHETLERMELELAQLRRNHTRASTGSGTPLRKKR
ncbi:MAG: hypothetical protein Q8Q09_03895 [Deltaproteobacteria bacterium]|nr:hypothetical protein [Deltaproteobacteria bacterium]